MIPRANITAWRQQAPWRLDSQVEQDLVLSRALVQMFQSKLVKNTLAFRGGTAIHKLFLQPPSRYSEDIDLVQMKAEPIGAVLDEIRRVLDPWLESPRSKRGEGRVTLVYRFESTSQPVHELRLKVEINTREHFHLFDLEPRPVAVQNPWFSGKAIVPVYNLAELLGTKLRALYQRKKGRDLFDLYAARAHMDKNQADILKVFHAYLKRMKVRVSRAQFEMNLASKRIDPVFFQDVEPLLPLNANWSFNAALDYVQETLVSQLPGDPWKRPSQNNKV